MKTLTIFCIGTSHSRVENWTLMKALRDLTDAVEVEPSGLDGQAPVADHVQVLFDGPPWFRTSNAFLRDACAAAVSFIVRHAPQRVYLFGHSRGAVLATMIAARLHAQQPPRGVQLLWLIDTVTRTSAAEGGAPAITRKDALTVYSNVDRLVRIVMEDDDRIKFPLEDVRILKPDGRSDWEFKRDVEHGTPRVELIRMPGTHGTGTQVNRVAPSGATIPDTLPGAVDTGINYAGPGELWPIGEACLIHALRDLYANGSGVPLTPKGRDFAGVRATGLETDLETDTLGQAYARIRSVNRRGRDRSFRRNDVPPERKMVAGKAMEYQVIRKEPWVPDHQSRLSRYGPDYRLNDLIVNEHHRRLIEDHAGTVYADALVALGRARWEQPAEELRVTVEKATHTMMRKRLPAQVELIDITGITLVEL